ncbi:hypothetical protein HanRHA438_Chr12g0535091 [Helianthus annuus]|nr:hypothetical protein HanRHA438_Chr12g0535091 [Helianthus annuus]
MVFSFSYTILSFIISPLQQMAHEISKTTEPWWCSMNRANGDNVGDDCGNKRLQEPILASLEGNGDDDDGDYDYAPAA